jgi:hypothetical protein
MYRVAGEPFKERFNLGNHTKAFFNVIWKPLYSTAALLLIDLADCQANQKIAVTNTAWHGEKKSLIAFHTRYFSSKKQQQN